MIKIEAVIRPERLDAVQDALYDVGIRGMTLTMVRGQGKQRGLTQRYRGAEYTVHLIEKLKLEVVVPDDLAADAADAIAGAAHTGELGDGKIFLMRIDDAIRVRTGEKGDAALR